MLDDINVALDDGCWGYKFKFNLNIFDQNHIKKEILISIKIHTIIYEKITSKI